MMDVIIYTFEESWYHVTKSSPQKFWTNDLEFEQFMLVFGVLCLMKSQSDFSANMIKNGWPTVVSWFLDDV